MNVLITGASTGIGRELAIAWAKRGARVTLSARGADALEAYAASKFALEALSMALRAELAASDVKVVVVRPGPVATPFRANASRAAGLEGYDAVAPNAQPAEDVGAQTIRAVEKGKAVVETSAFVTAAIAAARFVPPALRFALSRRV